MQFIVNSFVIMIAIYNYIFVIFKTYLILKLNKPKGCTLKIYLISYRTKASTVKSPGHS